MIEFVFKDLPYTGHTLGKMIPKYAVKEIYKWKSLVRDEIVFSGSKPDEPIQNSIVTLTRYARAKPHYKYLKVSFDAIKSALIEYRMVAKDTVFICRHVKSSLKDQRVVVEIGESETCGLCNGGPSKHAWNPYSEDYECVR